MRKSLTVWRDFRIILRAIFWNIFAFGILLLVGAGLLRVADAYPDARFFDLMVNAFHMAYLERVAEPGDGLLPGVLTFVLPVFTIIILGEGVVRVLAIYLRRDEHHEEWDRMVANTFSHHTVICGVDELGRAILQRLMNEDPDAQVVLIDTRPDITGELAVQGPNICQIQADMTTVASLKAANCQAAEVIIVVSGNDAYNLEAGFKAHELNPEAEIWIRLYRIGLAGMMDLRTHGNVHFFSPNERAAEALVSDILKS